MSTPTLADLVRTPISRIERRDPILVAGSTELRHVIAAMRERHTGAALVVDGGSRLVGIFTERDVLTKLAGPDVDLSVHVSTLMASDPRSAPSSLSARDALAAMNQHHFRHLPVVDAEGRPEGIITIRDILVWLAEHFPDEFLNLPPEPQRSSDGLYGG